ncbi:MAG: InlB B-repeat-containing protein, partial [Acutalibacteraceae bacterium]
MKKHFLKFLSLLTAVTFISGAAFLTMFSRAEAYVYETGDTVEFGSYPQTKVTDADTIAALDSVNKNWVSYRFYSGDGNYGSIPAYGSMTAGDFAKYADIELNGEKYRAVLFDDYRPLSTINKSDTNGQTRNGYYKNKIYYFKYEPITWKVLDPSTGLVLCEKTIDTQAYNNEVYWIDLNGDSKTDYYTEFFNDYDGTVYANNYEHSSIREWLNDDFYYAAFNETEKSFVAGTDLSDVTGSNGESVSDFVFLPSYDDLLNEEYGFSNSPDYPDPTRIAESTDYSKCLGHYVLIENGNEYFGKGSWIIRSSNQKSDAVSAVKVNGTMRLIDAPTYDASNGIRPAIRIPSIVEREYVLSFNANGGLGTPQSLSDKTNTVSIPTTELTYEGYSFKGWSTDKNSSVPSVMPGDELRLTDDITLYAVWGKNSYKTVWKSDGIEIETKDVLFGDAITAPEDPQKTGYTFIGWNPDIPAKMPAKDIEFNAKWEINSHTVTWVVADKRTTVTYKYGDTVSAPQNPVLEGYSFMGWDKAIPDTMPDNDLVFTAILKA